MVEDSAPEFILATNKTSYLHQIKFMSNLSGPIIVEENATHFLVGIHYNDRHLARDIPGRAWDGDKRRWIWIKTRANYENLVIAFKNIATRFQISDKDLRAVSGGAAESGEKREVITGSDDWGFYPSTDAFLQLKQLQDIEEKLDSLIDMQLSASATKSRETADEEDECTESQLATAPHHSTNQPSLGACEYLASVSTDTTFNELLAKDSANQSPIQRLHNAIRDEIRNWKDTTTDEEIHEVLGKRFARKGEHYRRSTYIGLKQLIWYAQEEEFYPQERDGVLDIYQMLHMFNSARNLLVKRNQMPEEMNQIHLLLCVALARVIWSRIRITGMEDS